MSKRILILANNSSGLYCFRKELIRALAENNTVCASTPDDGNIDDLKALGCRIILTDIDRRGINPAKDLKLVFQYWKLLRQEKPSLVITYTIKPNIYGGMVCRMLRIPYAVNITGLGTAFQKEGILRKLVVSLYKTALKKAKVVFFENSGNRQVFLDENIIPSEKTCLLSGAGVNLEKFSYTPYPEGDTTRFLFVGRVMKEKGVEELFEAMSRLHAEGFNCCLDMLGESEEDYAEAIRGCEAAGWLHFHGYRNDVRPFIEKAHCFVLPSYHEGMANTNLESAAMGLPVITSDIPGATIGKHCIINTNAVVEHDCTLGDYVHISMAAALGGTVEVGSSTWVGIGSAVRNNLSICSGATVGAGAAVVKNIEEPGTYVGIPARKM